MAVMKAVQVAILSALAFALVMMGVDVFIHDATVNEALRDSPNQFLQSLRWLFSVAWQYKAASAIVFGLFAAIVYVRIVPDVKSHG